MALILIMEHKREIMCVRGKRNRDIAKMLLLLLYSNLDIAILYSLEILTHSQCLLNARVSPYLSVVLYFNC